MQGHGSRYGGPGPGPTCAPLLKPPGPPSHTENKGNNSTLVAQTLAPLPPPDSASPSTRWCWQVVLASKWPGELAVALKPPVSATSEQCCCHECTSTDTKAQKHTGVQADVVRPITTAFSMQKNTLPATLEKQTEWLPRVLGSKSMEQVFTEHLLHTREDNEIHSQMVTRLLGGKLQLES